MVDIIDFEENLFSSLIWGYKERKIDFYFWKLFYLGFFCYNRSECSLLKVDE